MAFLYLFDLVTSISLNVIDKKASAFFQRIRGSIPLGGTLNIIVKCSSWIIYGSSSGIYYLYKKMRPNNTHTINDVEYVMITREEYDKLTKAQLLGEIHVE